MSSSTTDDNIISVLKQRRLRSLYNRPNFRLTLVSPYPGHTEFQLNMKRKAEILKYEGSRNSSMSNGFTRKENWSKIIRNATNTKTTNYNIDNNLINTECVLDKYLPTLTTKSDVPGPPILLYNDPTVPLYNYGNQMYSRIYATEFVDEDVKWHAFTTKYTEFFKSTEMYIDEDLASNIQTRTIDIGVIEITKLHKDPAYTFNLNIPLAFWIMGVQYDIMLDETEYNYTKSAVSSSNEIAVSVSSVSLNVYYNDTLIPLNDYVININTIPFSFNTLNLIKDYYALQYIGNINITGLNLPTTSGNIYTVKLNITYKYSNADISTYIRLFSSGVVPHVDSANVTETHNCELISESPEYVESSFAYYPLKTKTIYYPI